MLSLSSLAYLKSSHNWFPNLFDLSLTLIGEFEYEQISVKRLFNKLEVRTNFLFTYLSTGSQLVLELIYDALLRHLKRKGLVHHLQTRFQ